MSEFSEVSFGDFQFNKLEVADQELKSSMEQYNRRVFA
jgi:hypothetical protein